jgi:hypothetical protein
MARTATLHLEAPANLEAANPADSRSLSDIKANILIVDDRPEKRFALEAILACLNENIVQASSGKEALRQLLNDDFAVILLDVSMPGMDGFETASLIRQRLRSEHTPIIFITAIDHSENHIARGYQLGAVDYMLSPVVPEVLRTKVSVFVELHKKTELIKRAELHVTRLNRELEEQVAALRSANQELEAFNYSIAHDLRTPLRSMSGFARALLEDESDHLSSIGLEYARRIAQAAKYMDALLLDLLAYSRLTRAEVTPILVDLEEPVRELLAVVDREVRERKVTVEIVTPLGKAAAHVPTLKQVISNLISNGLKFTAPDHPPLLRIFTTRHGSFVRLWVQDNGIGVARVHHEKIFGLFQRLHDTQLYPGTGIGLALVRKGAERMGGKAGVESEPGKGSQFWVDLPASLDDREGRESEA